MLMFPPNHLLKIFQLTNTQLAKVRQRETNWKEILKFFSVLVLMTRFEFVSRSSLWLTFAPSKYVPAARFGKTGMFRPRFDFLFRCIRFIGQPNRRPAGMPAEVYQWKLVDDRENLTLSQLLLSERTKVLAVGTEEAVTGSMRVFLVKWP